MYRPIPVNNIDEAAQLLHKCHEFYTSILDQCLKFICGKDFVGD